MYVYNNYPDVYTKQLVPPLSRNRKPINICEIWNYHATLQAEASYPDPFPSFHQRNGLRTRYISKTKAILKQHYFKTLKKYAELTSTKWTVIIIHTTDSLDFTEGIETLQDEIIGMIHLGDLFHTIVDHTMWIVYNISQLCNYGLLRLRILLISTLFYKDPSLYISLSTKVISGEKGG